MLVMHLVQAALLRSRTERRCISASLHVAVTNKEAIGLYKKIGFKEEGLIEDYYAPGRHCHKLTCELTEPLAA
jgi:ribosomal protein S18 acetylase RimI-like enzyme